jgi:hypothetical protein
MARQRRRAVTRSRSGFNALDTAERVAVVVGVGVAAYLIYEAVAGLKKLGKTATTMYDQASELLDTTADPGGKTFASWYDPTQRWVLFYYLTFPDGNHHLVWSASVGADGTFMYDNVPYRIGNDTAGGLRAYDVTLPNFGVTGGNQF